MVPGAGPRGQGRQLTDQGQGPEEELAGPQHDHERRHQDGHGALASGAERSGPHPTTEAVAPGAATQVVQVVEVGVLAEGQPHAAGELWYLVAFLVAHPGHGRGVGRFETLVREPAEVAREARAAAQLEAAHLRIGKEPVRGQVAAQHGDLGQPAGVPPPGPGDGAGPVRVAGQQRHDHLAQPSSAACQRTRMRVRRV